MNPFAVLGLPEWPDLEDETVRAAWRAIAAATHPDRPDGGDLARYTQASAAYAALNSPWGRSEAYADLAEAARARGRFDDYPAICPGDADPDGPPRAPGPLPGPAAVVMLQPVPLRDVAAMAAQIPARIRHGHPLRLLTRAAATAGTAGTILTAFPGRIPASYLIAALTVLFTACARQDLAPGPGPAGVKIEVLGNGKE